VFYGFASLIELGIASFVGHFLRKAMQDTIEAEQWRWSSVDSRDVWIDAAKTMISASGIAAALLAAFALSAQQTNTPNQTPSALIASNVKISTVNLVICVCVSMFLILALSRSHEAAKARRQQEHMGEKITEGPLSDFALFIILPAAFVALSSFFIGFLFLARIVWHI
jgi:hypothetical protein